MVQNLLLVAAGGAVGATLRYSAVLLGARLLGTAFPWGTLFVNVAGSFLIGLVMATVQRGGLANAERVVPFVVAGMLGGFTTFSAFSFDALLLFERGRPLLAGLYVAGSVLLSLVAVWLAFTLVRGGQA